MSSKHDRYDLILRWITAGPLTMAAAVLTMASTPLWWPKGAAGIDNLIFAILLFPAFWAIHIFYALMDSKPWRALFVIMTVIIVNALIIFLQF
jgi:uncharacterized membrane protein